MASGRRTRVKRLPELASYDLDVINGVIDEAVVCHVGFVHQGEPVVIPTLHGRDGDLLYLHGSPGSRMLRTIRGGEPVSVAVTLLDGFVLARSLFHSAVNYRSVVLFGRAREVDGGEEKLHGLRVISDRVFPGRWDHARPPSGRELRATSVVAISIEEASAKVRTGGPNDEPEDYELDVWAGVVPLYLVAGSPIPDPALPPGIETPLHVAELVARHCAGFPGTGDGVRPA